MTFNPALDYVVHMDELRRGKTNRTRAEEWHVGGKGINVSAMLHTLGAETVALGIIAGFTGDEIQRDLDARGIPNDLIRLEEGMSRVNIKLKDGRETEINAGGPDIPPQALEAILQKLDALTADDTLVLSGSVPRSLPPDLYETVFRCLMGRGVRIVVDAERDLLCRVLPYRPFLIKPNRAELSDIVGAPLMTDEDIAEAAHRLQERGAQNVLVSLGRDGAMLLDEHGTIHRAPTLGADIPPVNTVGAGDSMVAGFLCGIAQGYDRGLRLGIAAGSATACSSGLADRETVERFLAMEPHIMQ